MKNTFNIGKKALSDQDIGKYKDFDALYRAYQSRKLPYYKTTSFLTLTVTAAAAVIAVVLYFAWLRPAQPLETPGLAQSEIRFDENLLPSTVIPPLSAMQISPEKYKVNGRTGGRLRTASGTEISIPAGAFADQKGQPINGEVEVQYREFDNPLEFFLSGIPTQQVSASGVNGIESAGMFEILAFNGQDPLILNRDKLIEVDRVTAFAGSFATLFFDPTSHRWEQSGSNELLAQNGTKPVVQPVPSLTTADSSGLPVKPIQSDRKNVFNVQVDVSAFPELAAYRGLLFKVNENMSRIDENVTRIHWYSARLKRSSLEGHYDLTLSIRDTSLTAVVYPVFDKKNYDEAMRVYQEKKRSWLAAHEQQPITNPERAVSEKTSSANQSLAQNEPVLRFRELKTMGKRKVKVHTLGVYQCGQVLTDEGMTLLRPLIKTPEGKVIKDLRFYTSERNHNTLLSFGRSEVIRYRKDAQTLLWILDKQGNIGIISPEDLARAGASGPSPELSVRFMPPDKGLATLREMLSI